MKLIAQSKYKALLLLIPILVLIVILAVVGGRSSGEETEPATTQSADLSAGVSYLKQLEAQDPGQIEATLKQFREQRLAAEREERLRMLTEGEVSVWTLFEDYAMIGDSRTVDFSACGFLPEERILAKVGVNLSYIDEITDDLKHLNPARVFICFGINDVEMHPNDIPGFCDAYEAGIEKVRAVCPQAEIYVNSIPEANEIGVASSSVLSLVPEYNTALEDMCRQLGCHYVNNDNLYRDHANLYDVDGIHFLGDIYQYWAANMIMAMYDAQTEEEMNAGESES